MPKLVLTYLNWVYYKNMKVFQSKTIKKKGFIVNVLCHWSLKTWNMFSFKKNVKWYLLVNLKSKKNAPTKMCFKCHSVQINHYLWDKMLLNWCLVIQKNV